MKHPEQYTADFIRAILKLKLVDSAEFHSIINILQVRLFKRELPK